MRHQMREFMLTQRGRCHKKTAETVATAHPRSIGTHSDALNRCTHVNFTAKMSVIGCLMLTLLATVVWCTPVGSPLMRGL